MPNLEPLLDNLVLLTVVLPFIGAAIVASVSPFSEDAVRRTALTNTLLSVLFCWTVFLRYDVPDPSSIATPHERPPVVQMRTDIPWFTLPGSHAITPAKNDDSREVPVQVQLSVGVDGLSAFLMLVATTFTLSVVIASLGTPIVRVTRFYVCLLLFEACSLLIFAAQDVILLGIALLASTIPIVVLIGCWGTSGRREAVRHYFFQRVAAGFFILLSMVTVVMAESWLEATPAETHPPPTLFVEDVTHGIWTAVYIRENDSSVSLWQEVSPLPFSLAGLGLAMLLPLPPFHFGFRTALECAPLELRGLLGGLAGLTAFGLAVRLFLPWFPGASAVVSSTVSVLLIAAVWWCWMIAVAEVSPIRRLLFLLLGVEAFVGLSLAALHPTALIGGAFCLVASWVFATAVMPWLSNEMNATEGTTISSPSNVTSGDGQQQLIFRLIGGILLAGSCLSMIVSVVVLFFGLFESRLAANGNSVPALLLAFVPASYVLIDLLVRIDWKSHRSDLSIFHSSSLIPLIALLAVFCVWPQALIARIGPSIRTMFLIHAGQ